MCKRTVSSTPAKRPVTGTSSYRTSKQDVQLQTVPNVRLTKLQDYQTSRLPNVQITKRSVTEHSCQSSTQRDGMGTLKSWPCMPCVTWVMTSSWHWQNRAHSWTLNCSWKSSRDRNLPSFHHIVHIKFKGDLQKPATVKIESTNYLSCPTLRYVFACIQYMQVLTIPKNSVSDPDPESRSGIQIWIQEGKNDPQK